MTRVALLLGGNVGCVEQRLEGVRSAIGIEVGEVTHCSGLYRTPSWGFDSADFVNQALLVSTQLESEELLDTLQAIEKRWGREREEEQKSKKISGESYCARTIDIDIIFYGDSIIESERLVVPHLLMTKRRFVLEPLAEIAPHLVHPKNGKSVAEILNELED